MIRKLALILAPLLFIGLLEAVFRMGAWEYLAEPRSHAGVSIRMKHNLLSYKVDRIDFVTLGSSRPEYGIDHDRVSQLANENGAVHANLSMPGTHWMTIEVLSDWLVEHHPEIQGGIIALSIEDLAWPSNGFYELGIVQPFRNFTSNSKITARIPFDAANVESFGSRLALFAWRNDIHDLLLHPFSRLNRARKNFRDDRHEELFTNPEMLGDMCKWGVSSIASCDSVDTSSRSPQELRNQCQQIRTTLASRPDYSRLQIESPTPEFMTRTKTLARSQLNSMAWPIPPIVVLMPTPRIWRAGSKGDSLNRWALEILKPLAEMGEIQLIDATAFFDSQSDKECKYFGDYYHQNSLGRKVFSDWLLPQVASMFYSHTADVPDRAGNIRSNENNNDYAPAR